MDLHIPDGTLPRQALERTTHLAIGAHADDLEIMAYHGIAECYESPEKWFGGIVLTDGAGSSRSGVYADLNKQQMVALRKNEQRNAADLGRYSFVAQLGFCSENVSVEKEIVQKALLGLLEQSRPSVVYLHNPADKHPTHIAVLKASMEALKLLSFEHRPKKIYGCEVWRDLDWLAEDAKIALDCSAYPDLARDLINVFESQIRGGKRYDLATLGRRLANATFSNPRAGDTLSSITWAIDLMPLLNNPDLSLETLMENHLNRFNHDVLKELKD